MRDTPDSALPHRELTDTDLENILTTHCNSPRCTNCQGTGTIFTPPLRKEVESKTGIRSPKLPDMDFRTKCPLCDGTGTTLLSRDLSTLVAEIRRLRALLIAWESSPPLQPMTPGASGDGESREGVREERVGIKDAEETGAEGQEDDLHSISTPSLEEIKKHVEEVRKYIKIKPPFHTPQGVLLSPEDLKRLEDWKPSEGDVSVMVSNMQDYLAGLKRYVVQEGF